MKIKALCATLAAIVSFSTPASAKILWFDYTARVDQTGTSVPVGTMITGQFSYDDALTPQASYPGTYGNSATYQSASILLTANFSNLAVSGGGHATVFNSHTAYGPTTPADEDGFYIGNISGPVYFGLSIWGPDEHWFPNTSLPSSFPFTLTQGHFPDPRDGDGLMLPAGEFFYYDTANNNRFNAVLLSITATPTGAVPEPSTWALMILGFGGIGGVMRGRRKSARVAAA